MKRLRVILLFLLLGAILNGAVAQCIARLGEYFIENIDEGNTESGSGFVSWYVQSRTQWGSIRIVSIWKSPTANSNADDDIDQNANARSKISHDCLEILPAWAGYAIPSGDPDKYYSTFRQVEAFGWPCLSLWSGRENRVSGNAHPNIVFHPMDIRYGYFSGDPSKIKPGQIIKVIPYGPLWLGLLANSIFYSAILWLLIPGPFALRRFIRRKRGLCVKCAYDLRGAEHEACPECGAVIVKANPA